MDRPPQNSPKVLHVDGDEGCMQKVPEGIKATLLLLITECVCFVGSVNWIHAVQFQSGGVVEVVPKLCRDKKAFYSLQLVGSHHVY